MFRDDDSDSTNQEMIIQFAVFINEHEEAIAQAQAKKIKKLITRLPFSKYASLTTRLPSSIDILTSFIEQQIVNEPIPKKKLASPLKDEVTIISMIQKLWRSRLAANKLYSKKGTVTYHQMLENENTGIKENKNYQLSQLMFGKTVAAIKIKSPKDASNQDFPATPHPAWQKNAFYHRVTYLTGDLRDNILRQFVINPDYKNKIYTPIMIVNNAPVEDLFEYMGNKNIKIYKKLGNTIGIAETNRDSDVDKTFGSAGVLASPWEIARINSSIKGNNVISSVSNAAHTFSSFITTLPSTIKELKESDIMIQLSRIAVRRNNPSHLLAACVYRMITALPEEHTDKETVQRIALFLSISNNFYKNNYERFAFSVYVIVHEISLLINRMMADGKLITNYDCFKKSIEKNVTSSFGLCAKSTEEFQSIAAPAMSGSHAFMIALALAKKMKTKSSKPKIKIVGDVYFEFKDFLAKEDEKLHLNTVADIHFLTAGPMATKYGIMPPADINQYIRINILPHKQRLSTNPVTLLIDVTSGLHKNLILDQDIKSLVEAGQLSIICYESYQKFGLLHTDQIQGGVVYGICSKKSFAHRVLDEFEINAKQDLETHFDMIAASFIHENCGEYIEKIKEQHFRNGALFINFFTESLDHKKNVDIYDEMISDLSELFFFGICKDTSLAKAVQANFPDRESFGHFTPTITPVSNYYRFSPNASDKIDVLIQITQLYLSSIASQKELFNLTYHMLKNQESNTNSFTKVNEILFTGLLMALRNLSFSNPIARDENYILSYAIKHLSSTASDLIRGRNAYQTLMDTLKSLSTKSAIEQKFFTSFFKSIDINSSTLQEFLSKNPSHEDGMKMMSELIKLSSKLKPADQYKHIAIIALLLSGYWNEFISPNNQVKDFKFNKNELICEAINVLINKNLLAKDIVFALLKADEHANSMAVEIIRHSQNNQLNEKITSLLTNLPKDSYLP